MDELLQLYLVAPKGHEHMASVVVATSKQMAEDKVNMRPDIKELTELDTKLMIVNITTSMSIQGYNVDVTRMGTFH